MTVGQPRQNIRPSPVFRHTDIRIFQMALSGRIRRMISVAISNLVLSE